MKRLTAVFLAACMLLASTAGCSSAASGKTASGTTAKTASATSGIHQAEVLFPEKSDLQLLAEFNMAAAVRSYQVARAYLDAFLAYDISTGNLEEYQALLNHAIEAFENTEQLSGYMARTADAWMEAEGTPAGKPTIRYTSADITRRGFSPLATAVYADEQSAAQKWAQDLTDQFDKAPAGYGIRTLSKYLGTDTAHAYAQLKQAQAILEGAEYTDIADTANKAYQTASVLKTAGTAAGLVIAVATAPAAAGLEAYVATGGITMSGVNTLLEVGSTSALLVNNGEDNWVTTACDQTESQMAPIGTAISIAGLAYNAKTICEKGKETYDLWQKHGQQMGRQITAADYTKIFGNSTRHTNDVFSIGSFVFSSGVDFAQNGSILGGTFTYKEGDGTSFTLFDTLLGRTDEDKENIREVLDKTGIPAEKTEEALKAAEEHKSEPPRAPDLMPPEIIEKTLEDNAPLDPGSDEYDVDTILQVSEFAAQAAETQVRYGDSKAREEEAKALDEAVKKAAETQMPKAADEPGLSVGTAEPETTAEPEPAADPEPAEEPEPEANPGKSGSAAIPDTGSDYPTIDEIAGTYHMIPAPTGLGGQEGDVEVRVEGNNVITTEFNQPYDPETGQAVFHGDFRGHAYSATYQFRKNGPEITMEYYFETNGSNDLQASGKKK